MKEKIDDGDLEFVDWTEEYNQLKLEWRRAAWKRRLQNKKSRIQHPSDRSVCPYLDLIRQKDLKDRERISLQSTDAKSQTNTVFTISDFESTIENLSKLTQPNELANILSSIMKEGNKLLLRNIVDELGIQTSLDYFWETCLIQQNGGMRSSDNTRFRTMGGVFFYIVRRSKKIKSTVRKRMFKHESKYWKAEQSLAETLAGLKF